MRLKSTPSKDAEAQPIEPDSTTDEAKQKDEPKKNEETEKEESKKSEPIDKGEEGPVNGENESKGEKKKDASKEEDPKKKKKKKRTVPSWATVSDKAKASKTTAGGKSMTSVIIEAIESKADKKGVASSVAIKRYVMKEHPQWPKMLLKSAMKKAIDQKLVRQVKGSGGFSGSYRLTPGAKKDDSGAKKPRKTTTKAKKLTSAEYNANTSLDDLLPHIITWVCEPKEASVNCIYKYLLKHFPQLVQSKKGFQKAIEKAEEGGQLERITGKGLSGTLQLVDGAKKRGNRFENAFEDAIIAMNEPKDASVAALKKYLSEYNKEYGVTERPKKLFSALMRLEEKGWLVRISGKGMSGSFRLAYPYYPSPKELWREEYDDVDYNKEEREKEKKERKAKREAEEEESSEEESDDESDAESIVEVIPIKKKRSAPTPRKSAPVAKKKKLAVPTKKTPVKKVAKVTKAKPAAAASKRTAPKRKRR